jgi:hypothetical protein
MSRWAETLNSDAAVSAVKRGAPDILGSAVTTRILSMGNFWSGFLGFLI